MLQPFQKNRQQSPQPSYKAPAIKPFKKVVQAPQRQDIRQSDVYKNAVAGAEQAKKEADYANSKKGLLMNTLKAIPQATADVTLGNIARFGASALKTPGDVARGSFDDEEIKIPGLSPFRTFQSKIGQTQQEVIEGKKGLGSLAWDVAQVPLAGMETGGAVGGISKGIKAFRGANGAVQGIKKATPEILDAFIPTTRGIKSGSKGKLSETLPNTQEVPGTIPSQGGPKRFSKDSSYKPSTAQIDKNVNPLTQEARKYKSVEEFVKAQGTPIYHGTDKVFKEFDVKKTPDGSIWFSDNFDSIKKGESGAAGTKRIIDRFINEKDLKLANWDEYDKYSLDELQNMGFDGVKLPDNGKVDYQIFNVDKLKTKSQLTDIWNKANGSDSLSKAADKIINPLNPKSKERGFIETVRNSPEISLDVAKKVDGSYDVRHNDAAMQKAQRLIFENPNEAERIATGGANDDAVFTANELIKNYDAIAIKAKRDGNMADFEVAMNKAVEIAEKNAQNLTEAGRTVQAASTINRLSPDGIIQYVSRAVKQVGGEDFKLSNEKYFSIVRKAEEIKGILDPKTKALKTFELIDDIYADIPKSSQNKVTEALNLPRSIMATADLSAPLRQGLFSAARNPKTFAQNFGKMFKYAVSEDAYRNLKADIITSPNYNLYVKHKLPLTDIDQTLTGREEQFLSSWAEKIPGFGKIAKGSNRAYSGFLNKMRMDLFDDFVKTAKLEGITDPKFFDDASKFVGSATGRGKLPDMIEPHAGLLNGIFFSPRLMASRANLINPLYYTKLHPAVRKEAVKTLAAFVGTGMSILGLAKLNGAEVGVDPRSADFGKIKVGNTRFDIWGGFQQYAVLMSRLISGEMVSSTTGKETSLTAGGFNPTTRGTIAANFLQSKENPLASFSTKVLTGKSGLDDVNIPAEVLDMFIPMLSQDVFDLTNEYGVKGALIAVPGAFGIGSQTYQDQIPMLTKTASGSNGIKYRQQPGLGETILNKLTGTQLSNIPKEQWEPLAKERLVEQKRQIELTKAKSTVLTTGEPQYVGDTFIFLDNGVVKTKQIKVTPRTPLKKEVLNSFYTK